MKQDQDRQSRKHRLRALWTSSLGALMALAVMATPSSAQISDGVVKIGILNDQSGPFSDLAGKGSVVAAKLALEDFKKIAPDVKVELLVADHQNKADVGAQIVRRWFAEGVDMVADVTNSAVALAVQALAREKNKVVMYSAVGTVDITGKQCAPTGFAWLHDNYNLVAGPIRKLVSQGQDKWFFIAADYAFGRNMVAESERMLKSVGGKSLGAVFHPIGNADYSSFLLQAQGSGAKVVALANAGEQLVSSIKQWNEFNMSAGGQTPVALLMFLTDIHGMGLQTAKGLTGITAWYWDLNDDTRAFAKRFYALHGAMPTAPQAAVYSAVFHYLKAVAAINSDDTDRVAEKMRATPVDDFYAPGAKIRADSKLVHDFYLVQVREPKELEKPWAYYKVLETVSADVAYRPLSESDCPLVTNAAK
ncbi:ABC transporter substrate-binding protein [Aquabacter sp. L1I39]|uniref:ABC transporter substrate-binding protein n=1 Tax=Aquabacter sp. L1I39 TaxID=2820278 RepID=UPI001ADB33CD|nr:ABC transporter substrate-binding protein [Aquabacter sp. L1I39]QTL04776.1 ABC transporter substrate-binding protein [Aquabacter sp. L1I39]